MKAVRLFEFGGPEKLVYGDHPLPDVGPGDVLVKVIATSVSRWDIKYRTGEVHEFYGKSTGHHGGIHGRKPFPMPMQLGRDAAGEVAAVGDNVTTLKPGDRVLGMTNPENTRSLASIRGLGNLSGGVDLPGHTMFGGYAQFVSRPESYWIKISSALDLDQGAAAMWPCATAHRIVADRLNLRVNDNVLITGASGGMGTATMRLAKLAGATVIATSRHAGKAQKLKRWSTWSARSSTCTASAALRVTISASSRSCLKNAASPCRSTRCCRSPRSRKRTPCWRTARTSSAASCCIHGMTESLNRPARGAPAHKARPRRRGRYGRPRIRPRRRGIPVAAATAALGA
jgi:D-arabinose 1-dehydrogenase-like Zn-dependent alcohol dehydrogenase